MKKPEILAPAGNLSKLKTAVLYGADAVYLGGEEFSMRTACDNFTDDELKYGIDFAHSKGKKIYVAANVIMKNSDLDTFLEFAYKIHNFGADACIISDFGAFDLVRKEVPDLEIHISTQANITNYACANMWYNLGAKRVVLARELSFDEIRKVCENTPSDLEIETFVHGAMCVSYSGRCLLSNYMTARDANKGNCAQSCRWNYYLMEEKRPGEYMPVFENDRGSFFFNSKDLCLIEYIPELVESGIASFKIEGRVKSEYYVATVVKAYREEVDRYFENPDKYVFDKSQLDELCKVSHRKYSHGFWNGQPKNDGQIYEDSSYIRLYDVSAIVESCDDEGNAVVIQKNKFSVGDEIEVVRPKGSFLKFKIEEMFDEKGQSIDSAPHGQMKVKLKLPEKAEPNSIIRKKREEVQ